MKFKINNRIWTIEEVDQETSREEIEDKDGQSWYHGLTVYSQQIIYIWKDMKVEAKRQTLIHELLHCYIGVYCSFQDMNYTEEILCNICSNSHDIIHKMVEDYFERER